MALDLRQQLRVPLPGSKGGVLSPSRSSYLPTLYDPSMTTMCKVLVPGRGSPVKVIHEPAAVAATEGAVFLTASPLPSAPAVLKVPECGRVVRDVDMSQIELMSGEFSQGPLPLAEAVRTLLMSSSDPRPPGEGGRPSWGEEVMRMVKSGEPDQLLLQRAADAMLLCNMLDIFNQGTVSWDALSGYFVEQGLLSSGPDPPSSTGGGGSGAKLDHYLPSTLSTALRGSKGRHDEAVERSDLD